MLERINRDEVLIADGAMGTMLFQHGLKPGECPEALNLTEPKILTDIARAYLDAGAEIVQTNTFGGSPLKLEQYNLDGRTEDINRLAVESVRRAVGDRACVSGSCGPSGKLLIPYGDTAPEQVFESAVRQMRALVSAGVDVICIETMTDITEAALNIRAAKAVAQDIPVMATMTFDRTPKGFYTIMGVTIENAVDELMKAGADIIGSNCGHGSELMIKIAKEFKIRTQCPLIIQPNAGLPEIIDGVPVYPESPDFMAERAKEMIEMGVSIIGGCCGTTPDHIRALRDMRDSLA